MKAKTRAKRAAAATIRIRRKNLLLDQLKIDRAKHILHAATETEAIHRALDSVADLESTVSVITWWRMAAPCSFSRMLVFPKNGCVCGV